jgi:hypothetical protein
MPVILHPFCAGANRPVQHLRNGDLGRPAFGADPLSRGAGSGHATRMTLTVRTAPRPCRKTPVSQRCAHSDTKQYAGPMSTPFDQRADFQVRSNDCGYVQNTNLDSSGWAIFRHIPGLGRCRLVISYPLRRTKFPSTFSSRKSLEQSACIPMSISWTLPRRTYSAPTLSAPRCCSLVLGSP